MHRFRCDRRSVCTVVKEGSDVPLCTVVKVGSDVPLCTVATEGSVYPLRTVVREGSAVPLCTPSLRWGVTFPYAPSLRRGVTFPYAPLRDGLTPSPFHDAAPAAGGRPWILRLVAGPAPDPVLLPPPLAASAMLSQDPIPRTTGRPFTSPAPTPCLRTAAPRAAVPPATVLPSIALVHPVAAGAGGTDGPVYCSGFENRNSSAPLSKKSEKSPDGGGQAVLVLTVLGLST